jgi:hypothetical protein
MDLVSFQNSLADHHVTYTTVSELITKIQSIPNHQDLKLDLELTLYICKVVENIIGKKSKTSTIDKLEIVIKVFQGIYPVLTPEELTYIKNQVQYFWTNKMIKRRKVVVKYGIYAFNIIKKKFF